MSSKIQDLAEKREQQLNQSSEESPAQGWGNKKEEEGSSNQHPTAAVHKLAEKREEQLKQAEDDSPAQGRNEGGAPKISASGPQVGHETGAAGGGIAPAAAHPTRPAEA